MPKSIFPSYDQIKNLLQILATSRQRNEDYIKRRFNQKGTDFITVLNFLININLILVKGEDILLNDKILSNKDSLLLDSLLKNLLLHNLVKTSNQQIRNDLSFLKKFYYEDDEFVYRPLTKERLEESEARNLLIQLGFMSFSKAGGIYSISIDHQSLLLEFAEKKRTSLDTFKRKQDEKGLIGTNGELEVIQFENERLNLDPKYHRYKAKHVSLSNVSAGYDILSWDLDSKSNVIPRYIEVKTVPKKGVQFFLTHNELDTARRFRERYYLYLLPLETKNRFNLTKLKIIQNPYINVFENTKEWDKQVDTFKITGKINNE